MEKLLSSALVQAVATFAACEAHVLSAQINAAALTVAFQVKWANAGDISYVMLRRDGEHWSAWEAVGESAHEYNEGVYIPEVISYICRIWCMG